MAKLETIEADGTVQQPSGMVQQHPGMVQPPPEMMMPQPSGVVHQLTGMVQQQPNVMQQPSGMVHQTPEVMMQPLQHSLPPTTFMQPPQDQPNAPNGTLVEHSTGQVLNNLDVGEPWNTGFFDCFQNPTNAIITAYLPRVTFGQIVEVLDEGEMNCALGSYIYLAMMPALCSHWLMGSKYRAKLRRKYNLVEAPFPDMVSHIFCPCCALAQEFRELKNRGLDPSLGWRWIHEQQMENPPPSQFMTW